VASCLLSNFSITDEIKMSERQIDLLRDILKASAERVKKMRRVEKIVMNPYGKLKRKISL
jgi:hypothetical protein